MDKEQRQEILLKGAKTPYGVALGEWLKEAIADIGDIDKGENWSDVVGSRKAKKKLVKLFSFIGVDEPKDKKKNPYL